MLKAIVALIDWLGDTLASHLSKSDPSWTIKAERPWDLVTERERKQLFLGVLLTTRDPSQAWAAMRHCVRSDDLVQADPVIYVQDSRTRLLPAETSQGTQAPIHKMDLAPKVKPWSAIDQWIKGIGH